MLVGSPTAAKTQVNRETQVLIKPLLTGTQYHLRIVHGIKGVSIHGANGLNPGLQGVY